MRILSAPAVWWAVASLCAGSVPARAELPAGRPYTITEQREPCAGYTPERRAFFGDLHVHTTYSQDASTQDTRNDPRDAYRFARGARLGIQPYVGDEPQRFLELARPLDFAAVTDHAELLGEVEICRTPELAGHSSFVCWLYRRFPRAAFFVMNERGSRADPERFGYCGEGGEVCTRAARGPWRAIREAAEEAYDRSAACRFTSFVGYEWTAAKERMNLHRNVIFRNERVPELPVSFYEAASPEALWRALRVGCEEAGNGCEAVVVPHNSNLSGGFMFETTTWDGAPLDAETARTRAGFEPLVEVMQHKGDSECLLGAGTSDELCAFEKLSYESFVGKFVPWLAEPPHPASFVRHALKEGLRQEERIGVNPFAFGLVGSTDTHLGTPGFVDERAHPGHGGAGAPASGDSAGLPDDPEFNPGGLAVLWAEENARDALFAAMERREAYGTSGPRLVVRFFGGWEIPEDLCASHRFAARGYESGVPMGGTLGPRPDAERAPTFAVSAWRDPGTPGRPGTPLQRVQIVKGWLEDGALREAVIDVAGDAHNGAAVDLATCAPTGPGFDALCAVWRDPDFDPGERAFYYARVLENPTCRWSTWACNAHGVDCTDRFPAELAACCAPEHRKTIQERAWTSPIWYAPASAGPP